MYLRSGKKNMNYKIKITDEFLENVEEICYYISNHLKAPKSEKRLRRKIIYNILQLKENPKMFMKIKEVSNIKTEYRRIVINNYIILYTIDEKNKFVYVSYMYYKGKNYIKDLL